MKKQIAWNLKIYKLKDSLSDFENKTNRKISVIEQNVTRNFDTSKKATRRSNKNENTQ